MLHFTGPTCVYPTKRVRLAPHPDPLEGEETGPSRSGFSGLEDVRNNRLDKSLAIKKSVMLAPLRLLGYVRAR